MKIVFIIDSIFIFQKPNSGNKMNERVIFLIGCNNETMWNRLFYWPLSAKHGDYILNYVVLHSVYSLKWKIEKISIRFAKKQHKA